MLDYKDIIMTHIMYGELAYYFWSFLIFTSFLMTLPAAIENLLFASSDLFISLGDKVLSLIELVLAFTNCRSLLDRELVYTFTFCLTICLAFELNCSNVIFSIISLVI